MRKKIPKIPQNLDREVMRLKSRLVKRNEEQLRLFEEQERAADKKFWDELNKLEHKPGSWPWGSWK